MERARMVQAGYPSSTWQLPGRHSEQEAKGEDRPMLKLGDSVVVGETQLRGLVAFCGQVESWDGDWIGVVLQMPFGNQNGAVNGVRYFACEPNHGLFVRPADVALDVQAMRAEAEGRVQFEEDSNSQARANEKDTPKAFGSARRAVWPQHATRIHARDKRGERACNAPAKLAAFPKQKVPKKVGVAEIQQVKQELAEAMDKKDVDRLRRALPVAASLGVSRSDLDRAIRVLSVEVQSALFSEVEEVRAVVAQLAESVVSAEARALDAEESARRFPGSAAGGFPFGAAGAVGMQPSEAWVKQVGARLEERVWSGLQHRVERAVTGAVEGATQKIRASVDNLRKTCAQEATLPMEQDWPRAAREADGDILSGQKQQPEESSAQLAVVMQEKRQLMIEARDLRNQLEDAVRAGEKNAAFLLQLLGAKDEEMRQRQADADQERAKTAEVQAALAAAVQAAPHKAQGGEDAACCQLRAQLEELRREKNQLVSEARTVQKAAEENAAWQAQLLEEKDEQIRQKQKEVDDERAKVVAAERAAVAAAVAAQAQQPEKAHGIRLLELEAKLEEATKEKHRLIDEACNWKCKLEAMGMVSPESTARHEQLLNEKNTEIRLKQKDAEHERARADGLMAKVAAAEQELTDIRSQLDRERKENGQHSDEARRLKAKLEATEKAAKEAASRQVQFPHEELPLQWMQSAQTGTSIDGSLSQPAEEHAVAAGRSRAKSKVSASTEQTAEEALLDLDYHTCTTISEALGHVIQREQGHCPVEHIKATLDVRIKATFDSRSVWRNIRYGKLGKRQLEVFHEIGGSQCMAKLPFGSIFESSEEQEIKIEDGYEQWVRVKQTGGARHAGWILVEIRKLAFDKEGKVQYDKDGKVIYRSVHNCIRLEDWSDKPGRIKEEAYECQNFPREGMFTEGYPGHKDVCLVSASGDCLWRDLNVEMLFRNISTATVFEHKWSGSKEFTEWAAFYSFNVATYARLGTASPKHLVVTVRNTENYASYPKFGPEPKDIQKDIGNSQYKECTWLHEKFRSQNWCWDDVEFMTAFQFLKRYCQWSQRDCRIAAVEAAKAIWEGYGCDKFAALSLERQQYTLGVVHWGFHEAFAGDLSKFSDIQGHYLEKMTTCVERTGGFLKKHRFGKLIYENEQRDHPLHYAAREGYEHVEALCDVRAELEAKDEKGRTPLHWAAACGKTNVITVLLKKKADVNFRDAEQRTPLHRAASCFQAAAIEELVRHGASMERDSYERFPIHSAAEMFENRDNNEVGNSCDGKDRAKKVFEALIKAGANIEACDPRQNTPMHRAAKYNHTDAIYALFELKANPESQTEDAQTPLHVAAEHNHEDAILVLIDVCGVSVGIPDRESRQPLHRAAAYGKVDAIRRLIDRRADPDATDKFGDTPLHRAARWGQYCAILELCKRGANVHIRAKGHLMPLHLAIDNDEAECIKALHENQADLQAEDNEKQTPLKRAINLRRANAKKKMKELLGMCSSPSSSPRGKDREHQWSKQGAENQSSKEPAATTVAESARCKDKACKLSRAGSATEFRK